ncbi:MAG: hypothetical protein E2O39_01155 [Planctomycetota bacterium]|nr:MAG: hypothetical protein E2O39_01155 [Planctomycetota bacterium]
MERLSELFVRHRPAIAVFVGLLTAVALFGIGRLQIDDTPRSIFRSGDETFRRLEAVFRDFGSDDNDCLVVLEAEDFFTPEAARVLRDLDRRLEAIEGVETAFGLPDVFAIGNGLLPVALLPGAEAAPEAFERGRAAAARHPLVRNQILSEDGRTALVIARLAGDNLPLGTIRPLVDSIRVAIAQSGADVRMAARLTGVPPLRVEIFDTIRDEQILFTAIGSILGLLVGFLVFHRPGPVLITSAASILAGVWAFGGLGIVGEPVNLLNSSLPMLIMVIALTDAVHLMMDILHSRGAGVPRIQAGRDAIRRLGTACFLTSLSTAVGFGSLAVSRIFVIRQFGIAFACAVMFAFVSVLTIVPLCSSIVLRDDARSGFTPRWSGLRRPAETFVRQVVGHARPIAALGVAATLGLFALSMRLTPDNRLTESTPRGSEAVAALMHCEEAFGGAVRAGVLCEWTPAIEATSDEVLDVIASVRGILDKHPFTHGPLSVLDLLELVPGAGTPAQKLALLPPELVRRFFRPDLGRAFITARIPDEGTAVAEPALAQIEVQLDEVRARHPDFRLDLTGTGFVARRNINVMIEDFSKGLLLAAFVILGVITLAFRSLRLGLISILPNAFPLVLAAGALVVLGRELQIASAIAFTVCLGIAVDDTIHFLARYQRELKGTDDVGEAVVRAFLGVSGPMLITTSILLAGFAILFLSSIPTTQLFAGLCMLGMAAALVGDLVLLPALMVVFAGRDR